MASTVAEVAKRLAAAPTQLEADMRRAVIVGGEILAAGARQKMPSFLRNVGASGAPLGVKSTVKGQHRPAALIRATGPAWLYDNDRRAHVVHGKSKPLATPFGPRWSVSIPAIKGKHSFDRGVNEALPAAQAVIEATFHASARLFG